MDIFSNGAAIDGRGKMVFRLVYVQKADQEAILKASQDVTYLLYLLRRR